MLSKTPQSIRGSEPEIARLSESLAQAEDRRRLEAVLFEDRLRRVEAELEKSRSEAAHLARLYEESDGMVNRLRSELSATQIERNTLHRELAEARHELDQRRIAHPRPGVFRQRSRPSPTAMPERPGVSVAPSFPKRGTSEPPEERNAPSSVGGVSLSGSPSAAIAAAVAAAAAAAGAAMASTSGDHSQADDGPTSARGALVNRTRLTSLNEEKRSSEMPVEIRISVPRALSPDELIELNEQEVPEQVEAPEPPRKAPPVTRMLSARNPLNPTLQPRMAVTRQVSAPYAPLVQSSSSGIGEAWATHPSDSGRRVSAASPPPLRLTSTSQAAAHKSGSATIPPAAAVGVGAVTVMTASQMSQMSQMSHISHLGSTTSGVVNSVSSQGRIGLLYRR